MAVAVKGEHHPSPLALAWLERACGRRRSPRWAVIGGPLEAVLLLLLALLGALAMARGCRQEPALAATWVRLSWTNPPEAIDDVQCLQVMAPGDTAVRALYASTAPLAPKSAGSPGMPDSAFLSLSTANVVGPAVVRLHLRTHNSAGWSAPSNPVSAFYAARDTAYLGGGRWWRGPGVLALAQAPRDSSWIDWRHQEVAQRDVLARLCLVYGYAARRGVRDTAWCATP